MSVIAGTEREAKRTTLVYAEIGAILHSGILIGEIVGSYRVERELGIGGMGAVYLAKHTILEKWAAVKMLRPQISTDQEAVDRFFTEAQATTAVRHGGIVDVYDFGHHQSGSAYLVMELLEGETLGERIRRDEILPERVALSFGWQTSRALTAAHAAGIVHRDLKPDNIFLCEDPAAVGGVRVKLLDFGIAKLRTPGSKSHTTPGELIGTPLFMSPEHCLGKEPDGRADVYSIACVLFYAISGRPPFCSEDFGDLLRDHVQTTPPHLTEFAPSARGEVSDLLFKCMRKDPARRPDARELAEALQFLSNAPTEVTVPPSTVPPSQSETDPKTVDSTLPSNPTSAPSAPTRAPTRAPTSDEPKRSSRLPVVVALLVAAGIALFVFARQTKQAGSEATTPLSKTSAASEPIEIPSKRISVPALESKDDEHVSRVGTAHAGTHSKNPVGNSADNTTDEPGDKQDVDLEVDAQSSTAAVVTTRDKPRAGSKAKTKKKTTTKKKDEPKSAVPETVEKKKSTKKWSTLKSWD